MSSASWAAAALVVRSPATPAALVGGWTGSQRGGPLASISGQRNLASSLVTTVDKKQCFFWYNYILIIYNKKN